MLHKMKIMCASHSNCMFTMHKPKALINSASAQNDIVQNDAFKQFCRERPQYQRSSYSIAMTMMHIN